MVNLSKALIDLKKINVLVVGDFMLDKYTKGQIKRISPEAPVSVLHAIREEFLPGGAGNVAINLRSLDASVRILGRIGSDLMGEELRCLFEKMNIDTEFLFMQPNYPTPVKNRFIAASQQILRVDFEDLASISLKLESSIIKKLPKIFDGIQILAISDYHKGFLSDRLLRALIDYACSVHIPVLVDPKSTDFLKYRNATLIKPNLKEAYTAANVDFSTPLEEVAHILMQQSDAKMILITRSEKGMSLFTERTRTNYRVRAKEVVDVTGAGDTVLAVLCLAMASGLNIHESIELSNMAAGIAIEKVGCAKITVKDLAKRALQEDANCKIFDESHLYALKQVLKDESFFLLRMNQVEGVSVAFYRRIKKLKSDKNQKLVLYINHSKPDQEFLNLLASLREINYIMLQQKSFSKLLKYVKPQEIYDVIDEGLQSLALADF